MYMPEGGKGVKKIIIAIMVLLIGLISVGIHQNSPEVILSKIDIAKFKEGPRKLNYQVYLLGVFPVGRAVFSRDSAISLSARAKSEGLISKIYPFEAVISSIIDSKTGLPSALSQSLKTKDKEIIKEVKYDQANNTMQRGEVLRSILPETYGPLSLLAMLRGLDMRAVNEFDFNINTNQKNYAFTGNIIESEHRIKGQSHTIYRLKARIFRRDKNLYHQSRVDIVFLDNAGKTPIYVKVFASGGLITIRLVNSDY